MSMRSHGASRLNCVCRCRIGFCSARRPPIHIRDGENVCIHRITPAQPASPLAASSVARISSGVVSRPLNTTGSGTRADPSIALATAWAFCATVRSGPGP